MIERLDAWIENNEWMVPLALAIALAFVFGRAIGFSFVYDDRWFIVTNPAVRNLFPIGRFFTDGSTSALPASGIPADVYRPLSVLSFAANVASTGLSPTWFRAISFLLHATNALFVWALLRRAAPPTAPLLAALLFAIHPIQVESVMWISQRSILMAAFGALASMLCWDKAEENAHWIAGALLFYAFSLFSKETALLLPLYLALRVESREDPRRHWLVAFVPIALGYLWMRGHALGHWGQDVQRSETMFASLAEGLRSLAHGAATIVWPAKLNVSYRWPSLPALGSIDFWVGVAIKIVLLGGIVALWRSRRRIALGFALIVLFWAPHSGAVPLITFAADRFLYLPMAGVAFVFCSLLIEKPRLAPMAAAVLIALSLASSRRVTDWRDDLTLWRASLDVDDKNAFAWACYGSALLDQSQFDAAETAFRTALKNKPTQSLAESILPVLEQLSVRRGGNDKIPDRL